jgi:isocitrate lyase
MYADLLWMETKQLAQALEFSQGVHKAYPDQWLVYNLSPSFNLDAAGLGHRDMKEFVWQLGKLGFVWQFITVRIGSSFSAFLASSHYVQCALVTACGLHSNGYISDLSAKTFATEGMKTYVDLIQRKDHELGTDMLAHQKVRDSAFHIMERGYVGGSNDGAQWSGADY